jgi:glyoxylase-like metal-dependent hydrolase (beta-lactamase superfamily II)
MADAPREAVVTEITPGLLRITQPLPWALDHVHCYALVDEDGAWTIIDTGLGSPGTLRRWQTVLAAHGDPAVRRLVVTHYHPDHLGAAAAMTALTAPGDVIQGSLDAELSEISWGNMDAGAFREFLLSHGMPDDLAEASTAAELRLPVQPASPTVLVGEGDEIEVGGTTFVVLLLPGHADGHIALLDRAGGRLFGGDVMLMKITPNIGRWPDTAVDPLGRYFGTLDRLAELSPAIVFPGHHEPIIDVGGRIAEMRAHHAERLDVAERALHEGARSAFEVAQRIWPPGNLGLHEQRFALVEALAHVEHLESHGRARQVEPGRFVPA